MLAETSPSSEKDEKDSSELTAYTSNTSYLADNIEWLSTRIRVVSHISSPLAYLFLFFFVSYLSLSLSLAFFVLSANQLFQRNITRERLGELDKDPKKDLQLRELAAKERMLKVHPYSFPPPPTKH